MHALLSSEGAQCPADEERRALQGTDEGSLDFGLNRALDAWYDDRHWFHSLAKRCMLQVSIAPGIAQES